MSMLCFEQVHSKLLLLLLFQYRSLLFFDLIWNFKKRRRRRRRRRRVAFIPLFKKKNEKRSDLWLSHMKGQVIEIRQDLFWFSHEWVFQLWSILRFSVYFNLNFISKENPQFQMFGGFVCCLCSPWTWFLFFFCFFCFLFERKVSWNRHFSSVVFFLRQEFLLNFKNNNNNNTMQESINQ